MRSVKERPRTSRPSAFHEKGWAAVSDVDLREFFKAHGVELKKHPTIGWNQASVALSKSRHTQAFIAIKTQELYGTGSPYPALKCTQELRAAYNKELPEAILAVTAPEKLAEVKEAAKDAPEAKADEVAAPAFPRATQYVLVPRSGSVQSAVRIGRPAFDADDDRAIPAALANTILGGGFDSRLMRNLREDKGYTYGAGSSFGLRAKGGAFQAQADVRNEVTGAAIGEFFKEFEQMRTVTVDADELQRAKRFTAGTYLFQNQLQGAVASALASNWVLGRPADYLSRYVDKANAVTAAQVQAVAREFFDPKQQSIVVVGDAAVVEQLKPYGAFGSGE